MPRRRSHTRNDMETDKTYSIQARRRSERLRPYYVDVEEGHSVEEEHSGEKLIRKQRLLLGYTFSSDDSDDEWIPVQEAHSHVTYVQPDNGVHGPGWHYPTSSAEFDEMDLKENPKKSAESSNRHTLPTEAKAIHPKQRKQREPKRAPLS